MGFFRLGQKKFRARDRQRRGPNRTAYRDGRAGPALI
jgi:hypothetical protein